MSHTSDISIRNVDDSDMAAIQKIYAHHVLHGLASWEETPPDEAEIRRRCDAITVDGFPYIVALSEGEILGYAYASKYRPRPAYRHTVENTIYVKDGAHRRGIGRKLLAELITRCTDMGLRRMVAIIGDSANSGSIGLHESAHFEHVGTIPSCGFKNGQWLDQVIMQRSLGEGESTDPDS